MSGLIDECLGDLIPGDLQASDQPCGMVDKVAFNELRRVGWIFSEAAVCLAVAASATF